MQSVNPHRLPTNVTPTRYSLTLEPEIANATFAGSVRIAATATEPTNQLVLNSIELAIHSVTVRQDGVELANSFSLDEPDERLTVSFQQDVGVGELEIDIDFGGTLNDKLRGFYRSSFTDDDGQEHTIATTQFESTNARRCFPCWDEPAHKAVFEVCLDVPEDLLAVSAMSELSRTPLESGKVRVAFSPTPLMSTYLLAFCVGELEATEAVDVDGVPVRIVHRPGRGGEVTFALDAAIGCLRWLTEYFDVPYFGDKIDLLAIPDFAFGAMENTGCVTFREVLLLVDPETTTQPEQQRSVAVIAHELAHMWFGNLVTMEWWEGLWLKEAFATFMEISATDAYRPDWRAWESFALDRSAAFEVDSLHSTRSIEYEVVSPEDAEGMYDVLTYEKGAAVVRMLEQYVGADKFRDGIRHYMKTHAFSNTVTSDLWAAIEAATGVPVDQVMQSWIYEPGFPLVKATLDGEQVLLDQRRFALTPSEDSASSRGTGASDTEWRIPVEVSADGSTTRVLMDPVATVPVAEPDAQILVDPASHGFFRTHYGPNLASRISAGLMDLTPGQRYRLLDDLFDLVLEGTASIDDYITLTQSLSGETTPAVWSTVTSSFATLAHVAQDEGAQTKVAERFAAAARPELTRLGFSAQPGEGQLVNEARATLFGELGSLGGDQTVIDHARDLFERAESGTDDLNASMVSAAVRVVGSSGNRSDYDVCFDRFQGASSPQVERRYMFALARFDDADAIAHMCGATLDGTIRSQDAAFLLGQALRNRQHGNNVWDFVVDNWQAIAKIVPDNTLGRMLSGVRWLEHGDVGGVHEFLEQHPIPQAKLAIAQHRERLDVHVALRDRLAEHLNGS